MKQNVILWRYDKHTIRLKKKERTQKDSNTLFLLYKMDQRSRSIVAPKKVTPRQVEANNGRSNHPLPSTQRNLQRRTDHSNIRFRLAPAPANRCLYFYLNLLSFYKFII